MKRPLSGVSFWDDRRVNDEKSPGTRPGDRKIEIDLDDQRWLRPRPDEWLFEWPWLEPWLEPWWLELLCLEPWLECDEWPWLEP